jgi:hypothetical protein
MFQYFVHSWYVGCIQAIELKKRLNIFTQIIIFQNIFRFSNIEFFNRLKLDPINVWMIEFQLIKCNENTSYNFSKKCQKYFKNLLWCHNQDEQISSLLLSDIPMKESIFARQVEIVDKFSNKYDGSSLTMSRVNLKRDSPNYLQTFFNHILGRNECLITSLILFIS